MDKGKYSHSGRPISLYGDKTYISFKDTTKLNRNILFTPDTFLYMLWNDINEILFVQKVFSIINWLDDGMEIILT